MPHPLTVTSLTSPKHQVGSIHLIYGGLLGNVTQQGHISTRFLELAENNVMITINAYSFSKLYLVVI